MTKDNQPNWLETGYQHIWHPYAQMQTMPLPLPVVKAEGVQLTLADGRVLLDGISSWWSTCHGHSHPHIVAKMQEQLAQFPHVMFAGLAHEQAYRLATRLAKITPEGLNRVFFSDSGSVAVEVALKMAYQYWRNQGDKNKTKFIGFRHGYHGDTMGAMSVGDDASGVNHEYRHHMPGQYIIDLPADEYSFAEMDEMLGALQKSIAGLIIEPLVQGAGGMRFHSADTLVELHKLCKKHNILFIADEIATGFGRTGMMFACEEAGITPDILCLGKGLTGGACSLAATLATEQIFNAFLSDDISRAFMHGPTYMATPLACAAANASLDLFESEPRLAQVAAIEQQLWKELSPCKKKSGVVDVRVRGAIGVVQLDCTYQDILYFRRKFVERGVWLRPFGDVIYLMPSFTISPSELSTLTRAVCEVVDGWE